MNTAAESTLLTLINRVAEEYGCRLVDVDLESHVINLEGSEENKLKCALALEKVFG